MKKEDFIQPPVELALRRINFVDRFCLIANQHNVRNEEFTFETNDVIMICNELGYNFKYSKQRQFYFQEVCDDFRFNLGFTIKYQSIEFGIAIINEKSSINSASTFDFFIDLISDGEIKCGRLMFQNLKELKEILKEGFLLFEDIKDELLKL